MLNSFNVMGRLTAAPELKTTQSGLSVVTFTIAVDRNEKNANGERETDFFPVVAWRSTAEFIARYFTKGDLIIITGRWQSRKYQDKNGNNRTAYEIIPDTVNFGGSNKQSGNAAPATQPQSEETDDDLPF